MIVLVFGAPSDEDMAAWGVWPDGAQKNSTFST
jgi:hypothetical protein